MINNITSTVQSYSIGCQKTCHQAAFICAAGFVFFIPISPALMNTFLFFTLVFTLLSKNIKKIALTAWDNPVARSCIIAYALFALGTTWSIADGIAPYAGLNKYNELWYIAILMPIFSSANRKNIGINIFMYSMGLILVIVYLMYFGVIKEMYGPPLGNSLTNITIDGGFRTHVITNILMSYACFISMHRFTTRNGKMKILYAVFFCLSFYYSSFISTGTTGQITLLLLISIFLIQKYKLYGATIIPLFISLVFAYGILHKESSINSSINKIEKGIIFFNDNPDDKIVGSVSQRFDFLINGLRIIQEAPLLGHGTGSIAQSYSNIPKHLIKTNTTPNPHNEYLSTMIQLGVAGLAAICWIFILQIIHSFKIMDIEQKYYAQGLVSLIVISSFGNSMIMDSGEGHFWAYFTALLFSPTYKQYAESSNEYN